MNWLRRIPPLGIVMLTLLALAWCAAVSGAVGWLVGRDTGRREGEIALATAVTRVLQLPDLGVIVTRLDRTGPAAQSGIERGDLIVALNGNQVQDARDLRERLDTFAPEDVVRLGVLRENNQLTFRLRLAPFPGEAKRPYLGIYYTARPEEPGDL